MRAPFRGLAALALSALLAATPARSGNFSDIWWNPAESGWGLTIADHESQLFAVWFTYRQDGRGTWFVIPGGTLSEDHRLFNGDIYQTTGPAYDTAFDPSRVTVTRVGNASIDFAPPDLPVGNARFTYTVGTVSGSKVIERQGFGNAASDWGGDFTDIWWNAVESGWGLTVSQHGNNVFSVLYTYDTDGQPLFVVMPDVTFTSASAITGRLYTTRGPWFGNAVFNPALVQVTDAGSATIDFTAPALAKQAPARGMFDGIINGRRYQKLIVQQPFGRATPAPGGLPCIGTYSLTAFLGSFLCTNNHTFTGSWRVDRVNFNRAGPIDGGITVSGSPTNIFQGAPGACSPSPGAPNLAQGMIRGSISGRLGSGTVTLNLPAGPESFDFNVTLGTTVLGTLAGENVAGRFSCH